MVQRILVVCVGNVCRSPVAEALFRHHLPRIAVSSAGLAALSGCPMDPAARAVLLSHGLDDDGHRARQLHDGLIERADLILGMEQGHVDSIVRDVPAAAARTFLLDTWLHGRDIPDPFRQPRAAFEDAYRMIDAAVASWLPRLQVG